MFGQLEFVENAGQWPEAFSHKVRLKYGAVFIEENGLKAHLFKPSDLDHIYGEELHHLQNREEIPVHHHAFKQRWIDSKTPFISSNNPFEHVYNYFKGNDQTRWRGNVKAYQEVVLDGVYKNISVHYKNADDRLKYNWVVAPGGNPNQIKWTYDGADTVWIENNKVIISTSVGYVTEELPEVFTTHGFQKELVQASFTIKGQVCSFNIGQYNTQDTLIIDPVVVFASFSGSLADNWGFTATYDAQGHLFGGGIVMAAGYPVTTGAFQSSHGNPTAPAVGATFGIDCGITKFNQQGTALLFSTYLGGNGQDQPHSMFTDQSGNLYIMGVTGSDNFPVSAGAYQSTFNTGDFVQINGYQFGNGSDLFITKLSANGSSLLASTYLGGTKNDGINLGIVANYSDQFRGEIVLDKNSNVFITASTNSTDFPLKNAAQSTNGGKQDAIVCKLNPNLSALLWSTYFGGAEDDAGYGIKEGTNGNVYICGGTEGSTFPNTSGTVNPAYNGGTRDGFVASFNENTGAHLKATYFGTQTYDQTFLIDLDKFNNVYVFGQTLGTYTTTPGVYFNTNGREFIHKVDGSLANTIFSTKIGRGAVNVDLVPSAFNVDDCLNILLSGWGGGTNSGFLGGNVTNMPITPNAFQQTTDGSDFYFMVLGANATRLKYGSYFGGFRSREHVDGGTSRFDKHGNVYQAVCAGCGGFSDLPTTPGAWSATNNSLTPSSNCNLGVIKINFETSITAIAELDSTVALDTSCNTLTATFANYSTNANFYQWYFGNGKTSNDSTPSISFDTLGTYTIKLVATDTLCDISDSVEFTLVHDRGTRPKVNFDVEYTSCDVFKTVRITNSTTHANQYYWDFGDGNTSRDFSPTHSYVNKGVYTIQLIAVDSTCGASDTLSKVVDFTSIIPPPEVIVQQDSCIYGGVEAKYANDSNWYAYQWNFSGVIQNQKYPTYRYPQAGVYSFSVTITDTICNATYTYDFAMEIERIEDRVFIPNAFTPNRDNINEKLRIAGNSCLENSSFQIYNSWGNLIFETDHPFFEFWDGYIDGEPAQEDVYVYYFKSDAFEKRGYVTVYY